MPDPIQSLRVEYEVHALLKGWEGLDLPQEKLAQINKLITDNAEAMKAQSEASAKAEAAAKSLASAQYYLQRSSPKLVELYQEHKDLLADMAEGKIKYGELTRSETKDLEKAKSIAEAISKIWLEHPDLLEKSGKEYQALVAQVEGMSLVLDKAKAAEERQKEAIEAGSKILDPFISLLKMSGSAFKELASSGENAKESMKIFSVVVEGLKPIFDKLKDVSAEWLSRIAEKGKIVNRVLRRAVGEKIRSALGTLGKAFGVLGKVISTVVIVALKAAVVVLKTAIIAMVAFAKKGIELNIDTMEKFRTVNFRALGSIRELSGASYTLTGAFGATREEAVNSIKAMSEAGFTMAGLSKGLKTASGESMGFQKSVGFLTSSVHMFSKATGVAEIDTARTLKLFKELNVSVKDQRGFINLAAGAMKEFGLTAQEVTKTLQMLIKESVQLEYAFGTGATQAFGRFDIMLSGLSKRIGLGADGLDEFRQMLTSANMDMVLLAEASGETFDPQDPFTFAKAAAKGAKIWSDSFKKLQGGVGTAIKRSLAFGNVNNRALMQATKFYEEIAKMSEKQYTDFVAFGEKQAELTKTWSDSMQTLRQQFNLLFGPILEFAAKLAGPAIDGIIQGLNEMLHETFGIRNGFESLKNYADALKPAIKEFTKSVVHFFVSAVQFTINLAKKTFAVAKTVYSILKTIWSVAKAIGKFLMTVLYPVWMLIKLIWPLIKMIGRALKFILTPVWMVIKGLNNLLDKAWTMIYGKSVKVRTEHERSAKAAADIASSWKNVEKSASSIQKAFSDGRAAGGAVAKRGIDGGAGGLSQRQMAENYATYIKIGRRWNYDKAVQWAMAQPGAGASAVKTLAKWKEAALAEGTVRYADEPVRAAAEPAPTAKPLEETKQAQVSRAQTQAMLRSQAQMESHWRKLLAGQQKANEQSEELIAHVKKLAANTDPHANADPHRRPYGRGGRGTHAASGWKKK